MSDELWAIETETHSDSSITHLIAYGQQIQGKHGAWHADCGRVVRGEVWDAGSVEGVRCKQCVKETLRRRNLELARETRQKERAC